MCVGGCVATSRGVACLCVWGGVATCRGVACLCVCVGGVASKWKGQLVDQNYIKVCEGPANGLNIGIGGAGASWLIN